MRPPDPLSIPPSLRQAIRRRLLRWYGRNARELPWRWRPNDPYAQWVAEIMLQQTQVDTVIPYYERFMKRFGDVTALARAREETVLGYWQGLGYYRRALNLHRAARMLAANGAAVPDSAEELIKLPGVGRYTAGAVASIAGDRRAAAVDGNVARVLTRVFNVTSEVTRRDTMDRVWSLAEELVPPRSCGQFNQALMDLGAMVCVPSRPRCGDCPLKNVCRGLRDGSPESLPRRKSSPAVPEVYWLVAVIRSGDAYLVVRRPKGGLWAGLWEFPNTEYTGRVGDRPAALCRLMSDHQIRRTVPVEDRGRCSHRLTHRLIHFDVCLAVVSPPDRGQRERPGSRWVPSRGLTRLPMSAASRKIHRLVTG